MWFFSCFLYYKLGAGEELLICPLFVRTTSSTLSSLSTGKSNVNDVA
jgi:hypothetical protein